MKTSSIDCSGADLAIGSCLGTFIICALFSALGFMTAFDEPENRKFVGRLIMGIVFVIPSLLMAWCTLKVIIKCK